MFMSIFISASSLAWTFDSTIRPLQTFNSYWSISSKEAMEQYLNRKKTHSHNQTIFLVVCHCNDKVNKWNELRQNPKSKSRTKNLSLCIVYTNWFRDYHLDNFSCPWGLFTQFSHINILLIGSFYLLRSSLQWGVV